MKKVYPITLTQGNDFWTVYIPDFDLNTQGKTIDEAVEMACDAICMAGCYREDEGQAVPEPSPVEEISVDNGVMILLAEVDFEAYRLKH